jgi:hypothetical protein
MPSVSKKQHNLMALVANDPAAAKRVGVPQSVGEEYMLADKGKKFGGGAKRSRPDLQKVNKPSTRHGKSEFFSGGGMPVKPVDESKARSRESDEAKREAVGGKAMKKGGMVAASKMGKVKTAAPSRDGIATKGKTKGKMVKMAYGGKC